MMRRSSAPSASATARDVLAALEGASLDAGCLESLRRDALRLEVSVMVLVRSSYDPKE